MRYVDFAHQYRENSLVKMSSNNYRRVLIFLTFIAVSGFLLFIIPTQRELKLYEQISPPSSYQASMTEYLQILENHRDPQTLPLSYENDLKQVAITALNLSSESKVYYPKHQKLSQLSKELEQEIEKKFPELIAQK